MYIYVNWNYQIKSSHYTAKRVSYGDPSCPCLITPYIIPFVKLNPTSMCDWLVRGGWTLMTYINNWYTCSNEQTYVSSHDFVNNGTEQLHRDCMTFNEFIYLANICWFDTNAHAAIPVKQVYSCRARFKIIIIQDNSLYSRLCCGLTSKSYKGGRLFWVGLSVRTALHWGAVRTALLWGAVRTALRWGQYGPPCVELQYGPPCVEVQYMSCMLAR